MELTPEQLQELAAKAAEQFNPVKRTYIQVFGLGAEKQLESGLWEMNFMITPFEALTVILTDEQRRSLLSQLTGGIALG